MADDATTATTTAKRGLLERLADGPVLCAEGYLFELERRGYLKAGPFVPEVPGSWSYRGQVVPTDDVVTIELDVLDVALGPDGRVIHEDGQRAEGCAKQERRNHRGDAKDRTPKRLGLPAAAGAVRSSLGPRRRIAAEYKRSTAQHDP
jgi:hypothetical protein